MAHDQTAVRQRQANHFQEMLNDADATLANPDASAEEKAEAQITHDDMMANLARLSDRYGVTPDNVPQPPPQP